MALTRGERKKLFEGYEAMRFLVTYMSDSKDVWKAISKDLWSGGNRRKNTTSRVYRMALNHFMFGLRNPYYKAVRITSVSQTLLEMAGQMYSSGSTYAPYIDVYLKRVHDTYKYFVDKQL